MYKIRNIIVPISNGIDLHRIVSRKLKIPVSAIENIEILRRALDARQKNHLKYNYTLKAEISFDLKLKNDLQFYQEPQPYLQEKYKLSDKHPFIIGAGPAGLFAALSMTEKGLQPFIFDRGDCIEKRAAKVADFWKKGILDEESNVQFGEGGAGAFSDGKLTSRKNDFFTNQVTKYFIEFGADQKIKYEALPHLGTDGIRKIVVNLRKYLESKGCKFFWNHKLEDLKIENSKVHEVKINNEIHHPEVLILAIGNAARDTFSMLQSKIFMESKPFAVGLRIEHPQDFLNEIFYGKKTDLAITGPATYRLTANLRNRGVYSFCMCPGGQIIGAASELNSVVTNGMSNSVRSGKFGNSAIVATVNEIDYGKGVLAGMEFQRMIEQKCFDANNPYLAPMQAAKDFMKSISTKIKPKTSFLPDTYSADLDSIFSKSISNAINTGMTKFNQKAKGFVENGIFVAPETRTSSPVRLIRSKTAFHSENVENLFPIGEGAGYAGGIMSSAADGYKLGSLFGK